MIKIFELKNRKKVAISNKMKPYYFLLLISLTLSKQEKNSFFKKTYALEFILKECK